MTAGVIKTQGTHLFVLNTLATPDPVILKMACPTGITGLGAGTKSQIDVTCLDATEDQEFIPGLGAPGQVSVPFNFIPTAESHQGILTDLKESGAVLDWIMGFSDGTAPPTLDAGDVLVWPVARTAARFQAYIAEVTIDAATNDRVTGTLTLQRSGKVAWNFKPAA
ncbi:phage tail tube protein [Achromobacter denitrificans]